MSEVVKKKIHLQLNDRNAERLKEMSERYGMSLNSLVAYILGQWLDNNYDLKDRVIDKMASEGNMDKLFENQTFSNLFSGLMKEAMLEGMKLPEER
ncbi:hypothetical protein [Brevibacillus sp. DP1.3A]|uniref:hypothetical protein n=1 Tax=Brevibacillus sp. DP1.3A TaxID=2738867 RepID=UPI00156A9A49|nr:hypothetical protein [Brevibacillus sp. DP1.3A]UED78128.1 hypothetical protein HP399_030990 [Brevibacillus sp. DP1.3A]